MSLEKNLLGFDYTFKDGSLLGAALTHPSITRHVNEDYERLEFLGDRVLGLIVSKYLYHNFPEEQEGVLSKKMASLVSRKSLASIARTVNLGKHLRMAPGEKKTGGEQKESNLSNAMEALIGALYLDGGFEIAEAFVLEKWRPIMESISLYEQEDPKSALQELAQKQGTMPEYHLIKQEGEDHDPLFTVGVRLHGKENFVEATGRSKRQAERAAAFLLLKEILMGIE